MVFWNGFIKRVKNAITRKEFNDLKGVVNDNTNNIRNNSADIATNSVDISNNRDRIDTNSRDIATNRNNINAANTAISQLNTQVNNLDQEKADKTQLDQYYTKTQSDNKYGLKSVQETNSTNIVNLQNVKADKTTLENMSVVVYATTIRNVRAAPQAQLGNTGFWYCDFETNLYVGDNNFHSIDIAGVQILNSQNQWVCLRPLKWYFNGGRVGLVLYTTTQYDINGVAQGADIDIWVNQSSFYTQPTKNSNSVYKG